MIDLQTALLFGLASLALTATPGPDMLLIAARSAAQGRMAGLYTYMGVAAGSLFHALLLALGLSQLFLAVPYAYDLVRYLGAAYLAFLAWQAFRGGEAAVAGPAQSRALSKTVMFRQGMISNVFNPKVALFFLALFPQFVDPAQGAVGTQIMILALILNVVGLAVNGTVILLVGSFNRFSSGSQGFARMSRYFLGTVFTGLAARLVFDGQR